MNWYRSNHLSKSKDIQGHFSAQCFDIQKDKIRDKRAVTVTPSGDVEGHIIGLPAFTSPSPFFQ
jgi:hypothetical protein